MVLENELIPGSQDTDVSSKKTRRRFSADDKRRIVREATACKEPGVESVKAAAP